MALWQPIKVLSQHIVPLEDYFAHGELFVIHLQVFFDCPVAPLIQPCLSDECQDRLTAYFSRLQCHKGSTSAERKKGKKREGKESEKAERKNKYSCQL